MRALPIEQAIGQQLACDVTEVTPDAVRSMLTRGTRLEEQHLAALRAAGHSVVYVIADDDGPTPDAGPRAYDADRAGLPAAHEASVSEDSASLALAQTLAGPHLAVRPGGAGKALLWAEVDGLVRVEAAVAERLNASELALLVMLPPYSVARAGRLVAVLDMIPLEITEAAFSRLQREIVAAGPAVEVRPFQPLRVGLLITGTEIYEGRIRDAVAPIVQAKVESYGGAVGTVELVPDDEARIAAGIVRLAQDHPVVVVTGGMSIDPTDRTPAAIRLVADTIVKYGIPILPNAMSMVAYRGRVPILGISSGVIYYARENILDRLLPLVLAGESITHSFLVQSGPGGLMPAFLVDLEAKRLAKAPS